MREGYQKDFLGSNFTINLPRPNLALQGDILQPPGLPDGEYVIPYIHYSLLMSRSTKQALYSAANVNLDAMKKTPSGKGRKWFYDSRVGRKNQTPNYPYIGTQWDRGHLTRRTAVTWGDSPEFVLRASNDSCAYTNASMQHKNFNEDEWRAVELLVSRFTESRKLSVITGPIFTIADRFFIKEFGDEPVRIPSGFWKIITYVNRQNKLTTQAYIFFQDVPSVKSSKARARLRLKDMQVTTTEVSFWTGLEFDQALFDTNPLKFYSGPESIRAKHLKALLNKDPDFLALDEGIVDQESIKNARERFPIDEFYALIDEISWVKS